MHRYAFCLVAASMAIFNISPSRAQSGDPGTVQNRVSVVEDGDDAGTIATNAQIMTSKGQLEEAEAGFHKALDMWSKKPPRNLIEKANCLNNLGLLYYSQGKIPQAIPLYKEALAIEDSPEAIKAGSKQLPSITAITLDNLGQAYRMSGNLKDAEPSYLRALKIEEATLSPDDADMAITKVNLSLLYIKQSKFDAAEKLLIASLPVLKKSLGANNPDYKQCVGYHVFVLRATHRTAEADKLEKEIQ